MKWVEDVFQIFVAFPVNLPIYCSIRINGKSGKNISLKWNWVRRWKPFHTSIIWHVHTESKGKSLSAIRKSGSLLQYDFEKKYVDSNCDRNSDLKNIFKPITAHINSEHFFDGLTICRILEYKSKWLSYRLLYET